MLPEGDRGNLFWKIKADGVVTHEFALDDYLEALETSGKGAGSIKVAL